MRSHVRSLAILEIVFGALGVLAGLGLFALFGGIAALVGITDPGDGKMIAMPILGTIGTIALVVMTVVSLPEIIAGIGLWREAQWGRVLSIIVCALNLIHFPIGTAMGAYGLWVLLSPEGAAYFQRPQHHHLPVRT